MWKAIVASFVIAAPVLAQEGGTAYEALRVIGTQLNREFVNRVISVTGIDGNPQPARWKVLVADQSGQSGAREIVVANGHIVSDRPAAGVTGSTAGAIIDTSKLNLDSSGAYQVASHTAETSHVVFALVSYTLRTDHRGNPTWIVTLETNGRQPVGTIHVGANKGSVTRVEGMYRGTNMAQVETEQTLEEPADAGDQEEDSDGDENVVKHRIKQMFRRTRRDAERTFERVRQSFGDFIAGRR
jgi:hypothetical protein